MTAKKSSKKVIEVDVVIEGNPRIQKRVKASDIPELVKEHGYIYIVLEQGYLMITEKSLETEQGIFFYNIDGFPTASMNWKEAIGLKGGK